MWCCVICLYGKIKCIIAFVRPEAQRNMDSTEDCSSDRHLVRLSLHRTKCAPYIRYIYIRYMVDGKRPAGDSLMSGGRRAEPVKDRSGRPPSTRHTAVSEHFLRRPKHNYTRPTDGTPNEWMRWPQTADHARLLAHRPTILLYKSPK